MTQHVLPQGLFPILDENYAGELSTVEIIEAFLDAEAEPFIVRSKSMVKADYSEYIYAISLLKHEMDFEYIIHHHVDQVPLSGAAGIHLTAKSMSVDKARKELGPDRIVGYSAHSLDDALKAEDLGADYILLGSIFEPPREDPSLPVLGLEELKKTCKRVSLPVYAIGGINTGNLMLIKEAGAAGFATLRGVYENGTIDHNISMLKVLWEEMD